MLIVKVEKQVGKKRRVIARVEIEPDNTGIGDLANYTVRQTQQTNTQYVPVTRVLNFPVNRVHILHLVARALERLHYGAW